MKKKRLLALLGVFLLSLPLSAVLGEKNLAETLHFLRDELEFEYDTIFSSQGRLAETHGRQHDQMVSIMKKCNELALVLYSQKQEYTFDLTYALESVTREYDDFNRNRMPYDRILGQLNIEIERYSRLVEALRRLPPQLEEIADLPDSLRYVGDSLLMSRVNLEEELGLTAEDYDGLDSDAFVLDEQGMLERDSCIFFATTLLKMYSANRDYIVEDSTHYENVHLRLKESFDYAQQRYKVLQSRIFIEGQTNYWTILTNLDRYGERLSQEWFARYRFLDHKEGDHSSRWGGTAFGMIGLSFLVFFLLGLLLGWLLVFLLSRFVKSMRSDAFIARRPIVVLLLGVLIFAVCALISASRTKDDALFFSLKLILTYAWLMVAILASELLHQGRDQIRNGVVLYLPMLLLALVVIAFRMIFMPNTAMNILFPPLLLIFAVWQLAACLWSKGRLDPGERLIGWVSFGVMIITLVIAVMGYIFLALLALLWWFFQLACIETLMAITSQLTIYREKRLKSRVDEYRKAITYVTGPERDKLLLPATWFYDMVRTCLVPVLLLLSVPFCLNLALNVFDFTDLFESIFLTPFVNLNNADGGEILKLSFYRIVVALSLFFVFRYLCYVAKGIYRILSYKSFLRKTGRKVVRSNELNLSLGNSIVSVVVWFIYIVIVVLMLKIPTGSLSLAVGGLSAGIGLAMKDVLNNFIYGIQLMSGRVRVGDWIECDGVRGRVTDINYQSTQIETTGGALMSFLNASLFTKNFTNLTRNNAYENVRITVGVAYGTDIEKVREVLTEATKALLGKDSYGRDIVEPKKGIRISLSEFGDSAINIAVKQSVLVSERYGYEDRAKEIIYNALDEAGISIPFPQRDIRIIKEEQ